MPVGDFSLISHLTTCLNQDVCKSHPVHDGAQKTLDYGTAGFRTRADLLDGVAFRVGLVVALRSKSEKGSVIGLMITASHNPGCDNGVKVVEKGGEMLIPEWEKIAVGAVRAQDLPSYLETVCQQENIDLSLTNVGRVFIGWDTRSSSPGLSESARHGIECLGVECVMVGPVTTPQLHFLVQQQNLQPLGAPALGLSTYYSRISSAFLRLSSLWPTSTHLPRPLNVDCANGIGAPGLAPLVAMLDGRLGLKLYNRGNTDQEMQRLNDKCGADFVKVSTTFPVLSPDTPVLPGDSWASFDGDADRIVYFFAHSSTSAFCLLDGDKLATLFAGYLMDLLKTSGEGHGLTLGLVQTAYANAASTKYIRDQLGVPVACVPTGVKHLHHKAKDFDVGVYFEANGHGTVIFSDKARSFIGSLERDHPLASVLELVNEATGDAISDLLLTEHILTMRGWSLEDWASQYADLPSRQGKVMVKDRAVVSTTDAERKAVTPHGLQDAINSLVSASGPDARAFVRPSGTEDVVRVYAEATTQREADQLATDVAAALHRLAGGVGNPPVF